jgi:endonuclease/exonuclease/phosphatase family metal-dependent hydrolase
MLRVMSFNIRYGLADDGINHWDHRKRLVVERIRAFDPDLLGLQECRDDDQAAFVRSSLPDYHFYGVPRAGGDVTNAEMAPVLFRRATFDLLETGCFWLSDTPHQPGSKSWGSHFARTATWARLVHRPTGQPLTFLNTHFDYHPDAVAGAARLLRQWLEQTGQTSPLIVTGDFNSDRASAPWHHLVDQRTLFDGWRLAHPVSDPAEETTFHGYGVPQERSTIDWILLSPHFTVTGAWLDRTACGPRFPSDHYPVLAALAWRELRPKNGCNSG